MSCLDNALNLKRSLINKCQNVFLLKKSDILTICSYLLSLTTSLPLEREMLCLYMVRAKHDSMFYKESAFQ